MYECLSWRLAFVGTVVGRWSLCWTAEWDTIEVRNFGVGLRMNGVVMYLHTSRGIYLQREIGGVI